MSEGPSITLLGTEEINAPGWLKILPIDRTGKKFQINSKKLTYWAGTAVVLFAMAQIVLDDGTVPAAEKSTISSPETPGSSLDVTEATSQEFQSGRRTSTGPRPVKFSGPEVISRPRNLGLIPPGSMFEAKLASGASNGLARAEVTKPLVVNGDVIIPEGSFLVGSGSSTEERLFIRFNQAVFKDGTFGAISAEACDKSDQIVGLKGSTVGNKALNLAGSLGLGFVGGFSTTLQDAHGQGGVAITQPTLKNALLAGTATTALEESRNLMSDFKNRVPIIEVPAGANICVIANGSVH
jgi:hypothetical protein